MEIKHGRKDYSLTKSFNQSKAFLSAKVLYSHCEESLIWRLHSDACTDKYQREMRSHSTETKLVISRLKAGKKW